jgi:hypothetical protein
MWEYIVIIHDLGTQWFNITKSFISILQVIIVPAHIIHPLPLETQ